MYLWYKSTGLVPTEVCMNEKTLRLLAAIVLLIAFTVTVIVELKQDLQQSVVVEK